MADSALTTFVETVCGESHLRVEEDFGGGFVRLRSSEAERRQAAQDIRSSEDIVIELLRNSRDAGARHVFIALQRDESMRTIVVIDDGCGIPQDMREHVFEPRVTSKLDTARMDKWGMHGRGMALYSVSVNAEQACVARSGVGRGTSLLVRTDLSKLGEKTDQSTFPHFEVKDGVHAMRGPKNILRTIAEFSLEHRKECLAYVGSPTEIAATIYAFGMATTTPSVRAFGSPEQADLIVRELAFCADPDTFASCAEGIGLQISSRSARRIIDGEIASLPSVLERIQDECAPQLSSAKSSRKTRVQGDVRGLKIDARDADELKDSVRAAFADLAPRYYLIPDVEVGMRVTSDAIHLSIPLEKLR